MADEQSRADRTVYVENVCSLSEKLLKNALKKYGDIASCRSYQSHAFVEFRTQQSAEDAVARGSVDAYGISLILRRYESHLDPAVVVDDVHRPPNRDGRSRADDQGVGGDNRRPAPRGRSRGRGGRSNGGSTSRGGYRGDERRYQAQDTRAHQGKQNGYNYDGENNPPSIDHHVRSGHCPTAGQSAGPPVPRPLSNTEARPIPSPVPRPLSNAEARPLTSPVPRPLSNTEARPLTSPVPRPLSNAEARPLTSPVPRPLSNAEARPLTSPVPRPLSNAEARPLTSPHYSSESALLQPIKILISNISCQSVSDEAVKALLTSATIEGTFQILHHTRTDVQVLVKMDITQTANQRGDMIFCLLQRGRCTPQISDAFCNSCIQSLKGIIDSSWMVGKCEWSGEEEEERLVRSEIIEHLKAFNGEPMPVQVLLGRCRKGLSEGAIKKVCSDVVEILPFNKTVVFCGHTYKHALDTHGGIGAIQPGSPVPVRGMDVGPLFPFRDEIVSGPLHLVPSSLRGAGVAPIEQPPQRMMYPSMSGTPPVVHSVPPHLSYDRLASRQASVRSLGDKRTPRYHDRSKLPLVLADIQIPLTRETYKDKFNKLLFWEEGEHMVILRDKCDGRYLLTLQSNLRSTYPTQRHGIITEISGDTVAYAMQASEGATVVIEQGTKVAGGQLLIQEDVKFGIELSFQNYAETEEKLSVTLPEDSVGLLRAYGISEEQFSFRVKVQFELKHSYFDGLHRSVDQLSPATIARVLPKEFPPFLKQALPKELDSYTQLCSQDQRDALQTILSLPPNSPPLLVRGAFGTGKTFLLAAAVHCLFRNERGGGGGGAVRVLVCTQQHTSAVAFLECFHNKFSLATSGGDDHQRCIIRLVPDSKRDAGYSECSNVLTGQELKNEKGNVLRFPQLLMVTTGGTSRQLYSVFSEDFFTHILLDEGAQLREPEAMAPLQLSCPRTRIIISGDEYQVGPNLLVLGEDARECGLKLSLLERLHHHYIACNASMYEAVLTTNHRSHPDILGLANALFYKCNLRTAVNPGCSHPLAPFPLVFVCSSADMSASLVEPSVDNHEAIVLLERARVYANSWPESTWGKIDYSQLCIVSVGRGQLYRIAKLLRDKQRFPSAMNTIQRQPTYDLQGRQFRAVFVSTSEPTEVSPDDGSLSPSNHTKSICDPFVFNTVMTRAQSLVVCVGNPFLLLRLEQSMVRKYGDRGKCWSHYLKACLDHKTVDCSSVQSEPSVLLQKLSEAVAKNCIAP